MLSPSALKAEGLAEAFQSNFQSPDEDPGDIYVLPSPDDPTPDRAFISRHDTETYLRRLKARKATGLDGIGPALLKNCSDMLSTAVMILINSILATTLYPAQWSRGWVCAVPKIRVPSTTNHFRPIVILATLNKVFEKHLLKLLRPFSHVHSRQFGFCKGSGCGDALLRAQLDVVELLEGQTKVAFSFVALDCRRAFDQLPHSAILAALKRRNVPRFLLAIISSWLKERLVKVRVAGAESSWKAVPSGVPQGSLLGPLLFNLATDDIASVKLSQGTRLVQYADDLLLIRHTASARDQAALQEDVSAISTFLSSIGLTLNASKSKLLNVSLRGKHVFSNPLHIGDEPLEQVEEL